MIAKSNRLPLQDEEAGALRSGASNGKMTSRSVASRPATFSAWLRPVTVSASPSNLPGLEQLPDHRGNAAGAVEALAQIFARRLHVDQQRQVVAVRHPVVGRDLDAGMARHGDDVRLGVARSADRA